MVYKLSQHAIQEPDLQHCTLLHNGFSLRSAPDAYQQKVPTPHGSDQHLLLIRSVRLHDYLRCC